MPNIYLYNVSDDPKVLDKTLGTGILYSGDFREAIDLHVPDFRIEDTVNADYNYCSITIPHEAPDPDEVRYYFVEVENVRTGLSILHCTLDHLMTFNAAIKAAKVWCRRSAVLQSRYMYDSKAPISQKKEVSAQPLSCIGAHSQDMILITVG